MHVQYTLHSVWCIMYPCRCCRKMLTLSIADYTPKLGGPQWCQASPFDGWPVTEEQNSCETRLWVGTLWGALYVSVILDMCVPCKHSTKSRPSILCETLFLRPKKKKLSNYSKEVGWQRTQGILWQEFTLIDAQIYLRRLYSAHTPPPFSYH